MSAGGVIEIDVVLKDKKMMRDLDASLRRSAQMARRVNFGGSSSGLDAGLRRANAAGMDFDSTLTSVIGRQGEAASGMAAMVEQVGALGESLKAIPAEAGAEAAESLVDKVKAALSVAGIAAALQQVVTVGAEFDSTLNAIRGTSGATAAEMAQITDVAKQLGNDLTLPATSATSAATAMLELSKGGLSVKDAMGAAKGTLALAAAAQIDAGEAATIQADALNTFSLKAADAARVADVLANAANASSADIGDIASGLSQAGAVSAQFGMSIEDTAAALGMLASNGIKGSDAGTLVKSTLLALTDTSDPARTAIADLGLTIYDQQGKFVGMRRLLDDLGKASKTMTEEQYQAATATLFGSDAMRLAGVAASKGAGDFDKMRAAVGKQGSAAKLAAELNAGLPGALEKVGNSVESVSLAVYDMIRGPLTELAMFGAKQIGNAEGWLTSGFEATTAALRPLGNDLKEIGQTATEAGGALSVAGDGAKAAGSLAVDGLKPVVGVASGIVHGFAALPGPVQTAALAMGAFALVRNRIATPAPLRALSNFNSEMKTQAALARMSGTQLTGMGRAMAAYRTSTVPAVAAMRGFTTQVGAIRAGATAAGAPISALAGTMRTMGERSGNLGAIGRSFSTAAANAGKFGTMAGTAAAGATAMKIGAGGLMGALGGPLGIALGAATIGLSMYSQKQQEAAQSAAQHQQQVESLIGSIDAQTGKLSSAGLAELENQLASGQYGGEKKANPYDSLAALNKNKDFGVDNQTFTEAAGGDVDKIKQVNAALDAQVASALDASDTWHEYRDSMEKNGISEDDTVAALRGNEEALKKFSGNRTRTLAMMRREMDESGRSAVLLGHQMGQANDRLSETQKRAQQQAESLRKVTPEARTLADAMQILGDKTSTAADKTKALKTALDVLSGGAEGVDAAQGQGMALIEQLPSQWEAAASAVGGYNALVSKATGRIRVDNEATRALSTSIASVKTTMNEAASAAYEYALKSGLSQEEAKQAAVTASQVIYDGFMKTAEGARAAGVDVNALMLAMNVLPPQKLVEFMALGSDKVKQELFLIKNQIDNDNDKTITVSTVSDEAKKTLTDLGATVKTLPDGRVEITALTEDARRKIAELLKPETKQVTVNYQSSDSPLGPNNLTSPNVGNAGSAHDRATGGPIGWAVGGGIGRDGAVRGPGSGTSDSIPTQAAVGGHVITAAEVNAAGGHAKLRERFAALTGGKDTGAQGKWQMRPVNLSNGEHYLNPADVAAAGGHDGVFRFRRGLTDRAQGLYLGGVIRSAQVGKANDGLPYIGGARDCSMWVSWIVSAAKDEPLQRLFTTHTLLGGQTGGLVSGASSGDLLTVGTSQEHMAATVMTADGPVNTESGGNSNPSQVRWGRGAAGAFDSQFTNRYHLPLSLINPKPDLSKGDSPSDSKSISSDDDDSSNTTKTSIEAPKAPKLEDVAADAAKIGVRGILETLGLEDSVLADPDKTVIGRAWQIGQNTDRYRREQGENPSDDGGGRKLSTSEKQDLKEAYDEDIREIDRVWRQDKLNLRTQYKGDPQLQQKLLDRDTQHTDDKATRRNRYDRERKGLSNDGGGGDSTSTDDSTEGGANSWGARTHPTGTSNPYDLVDSAPYDSGRKSEQWSKEIAAALTITGMAQTYAQGMRQQGDIESGGNPRAVGPGSPEGTPKGWLQVKDQTFASMRDPKLPNDPFNVLANGVAAINWTKERWGGPGIWPAADGYAAGGLRPMSSRVASVVPPNTWRVIGDRQINDEFYIPDTDDPQHVALGAEWARRRGYQLVQMHADGGIAARAAGGQSAIVDRLDRPNGPTYNQTYEGSNYNHTGGGDADAFFRGARRHDRIGRQGSGIERTGRRGSRRG